MSLKLTNDQEKKNDEQSASLDQLLTYVYRFFWVINILVALAIVTAAFIFLLVPMYNNIQSNEEIVKKQDEYAMKLKYYKNLKELEKVYQNIDQNDKDKINRIVNNSGDKEEIFRELQYIAKRNNIKLDSVDPVLMDKNFELLNLANNTTGGRLLSSMKIYKTTLKMSNVSYEGMLAMIKQMEFNLRIMDVNKVNYNPYQQTAQLEILTYQQ